MQSQSVQEAAAHPSTRWRSLSELLDSQAARTASAPAVSFPTGHLSYGELAAESQLAADETLARPLAPRPVILDRDFQRCLHGLRAGT